MINTFIAVLYSILSTLPLFLLLTFPIRAVVVSTIVLLLLIPMYRAYIKIHIYDFEDIGSVIPSVFKIFLSLISILISLFLLDGNIHFLIRAIPILCVFYIAYIIIVYDFLGNYDDLGSFKVRYNHLQTTDKIVQLFIVFKVIILVSLLILNREYGFTIIWILSIVFDFIIIVDKRLDLKFMGLYQDGFKNIYKRVNYSKWVFIIIIVSLSFSTLLGSNSCLLPYTKIIEFLSNFSLEPAETVPYDHFFHEDVEPESEDSFFEHLNENIEPIQVPQWLSQLMNMFVYILLFCSSIAILYLLLYPLISPLFIKKGGKVTFKEYYRHLLDKIKEFFVSIFNTKKGYKKVLIQEVYSEKTLKNRQLSIKKVREVNTLLRYYLKLITWNKKNKNISSFTVNEFFNSLDNTKKSVLKLNMYFNLGFYSERVMGSEKIKEVKFLVKEIIKDKA